MNRSRSTVLVIDDDDAFVDETAAALRSDGWAVMEARSGHHGVQLLRSCKQPHSIVLEPNLAGGAWYQFLHLAIRAAGSSRLLVVTAFWSMALAEEALSAGASACLRKPIPSNRLRSLIRETADAAPAFEMPLTQRPPSLASIEWEYVNRIIRDCRGNMSQAARLLGIHRPSLYKRLRKHPPPR